MMGKRNGVLPGGGETIPRMRAADFATDRATRSWWNALAGLAVFMATFGQEPRILSSWESFTRAAEELPAEVGKLAADAASAVARAGAGAIGALIGGLLQSPGGLLLLAGVAAYFFRDELARALRGRGPVC